MNDLHHSTTESHPKDRTALNDGALVGFCGWAWLSAGGHFDQLSLAAVRD